MAIFHPSLSVLVPLYAIRHCVIIQHGAQVVESLLWNLQSCFLLVLPLFCFLPGESCPPVGVWVAVVRTQHAEKEQEQRRLREEPVLSKVKASLTQPVDR